MAFPVLTKAEIRAWEESTWATGVTPGEVIGKAGKAIASRLLTLTQPAQRILIVAGKGHNGDDARAAGRALEARTFEIVEVRDPIADLPRLQARLVDFQPAWILDGLFGIGLDRPLDDSWIAVINLINDSRCAVAAVDIPSGLDADTGKPQGAAIRADLTLTLGAAKTGMIPCAAAEYLGRVDVLGHIGLTVAPQSRQECYWTAEDDFADYPPNRRPLSHKGTYGHLTILAGSAGYHGAAVLAARGALRARPGLVSVVTQPGVFLQIGSQLASAMVHRYKSKQSPPDKTTAILAGPGLAAVNIPADYRDWVQRLWRESFLAMVADASALDWLPRRAVGSNPARVLTPHPGEAARMLHIKPEAVEADRVGALRQLSQLYGNAWVALKGHQTMVGRHIGPIYINNTGNPGLAQGGTGDVLAGYIGGLIAQPELQKDACRATRYAVWEHGRTADLLEAERGNWNSEELAAELGRSCSGGSQTISRIQRTASRESR